MGLTQVLGLLGLPTLGLTVRQAKGAAASKERQKVARCAHVIREKQLNFIPVGATFGALGPQATQFVNDAAPAGVVDFHSAKCAISVQNRGVCRKQAARVAGRTKVQFKRKKVQFNLKKFNSIQSSSIKKIGFCLAKKKITAPSAPDWWNLCEQQVGKAKQI